MSLTQGNAPQAPTEEAQTETAGAPAAAADEGQMSPKFAALARKERAIHKMRQEFEADKKKWQEEMKSRETDYIPRSKLKESTWDVLDAEGIDYDNLTQSYLTRTNQDPILQKALSKLDTVEKATASLQQRIEENQTKQYDQAVKNLTREAKILIESGDEYEAIKAAGEDGLNEVINLIKDHFEDTDEVLSVEEAAKQIEEQYLEEAMKYASLSKVKKRLNPEPAVAEETKAVEPKSLAQAVAEKKHQPAAAPGIKTLTNAATTVPAKPLTAKERRERAIAAFRGQQA